MQRLNRVKVPVTLMRFAAKSRYFDDPRLSKNKYTEIPGKKREMLTPECPRAL
jgi:hypothetical protein